VLILVARQLQRCQ